MGSNKTDISRIKEHIHKILRAISCKHKVSTNHSYHYEDDFPWRSQWLGNQRLSLLIPTIFLEIVLSLPHGINTALGAWFKSIPQVFFSFFFYKDLLTWFIGNHIYWHFNYSLTSNNLYKFILIHSRKNFSRQSVCYRGSPGCLFVELGMCEEPKERGEDPVKCCFHSLSLRAADTWASASWHTG